MQGLTTGVVLCLAYVYRFAGFFRKLHFGFFVLSRKYFKSSTFLEAPKTKIVMTSSQQMKPPSYSLALGIGKGKRLRGSFFCSWSHESLSISLSYTSEVGMIGAFCHRLRSSQGQARAWLPKILTNIYQSVYLSINLSIYLSIYLDLSIYIDLWRDNAPVPGTSPSSCSRMIDTMRTILTLFVCRSSILCNVCVYIDIL